MGQINTEYPVQAVAGQTMTEQTTKKTEEQKLQEQKRKELKEEREENKKKLEERKKEETTSMLQTFQRDMEAAKQNSKRWKKNKINVSAASYMMRIANASTTAGVSGIMNSARAQQGVVKRSGASKAEISKALRILKRVIASGNRKITGLKKEQQIQNRKLAAKKDGNIKEMERLHKELRRRKKARKARENAEMADTEYVIIHNHDDDLLCPNEFSMDGLIRDLSDSLPAGGINTEIGADAGVCCAAGGEAAALDITV